MRKKLALDAQITWWGWPAMLTRTLVGRNGSPSLWCKLKHRTWSSNSRWWNNNKTNWGWCKTPLPKCSCGVSNSIWQAFLKSRFLSMKAQSRHWSRASLLCTVCQLYSRPLVSLMTSVLVVLGATGIKLTVSLISVDSARVTIILWSGRYAEALALSH